MMWTLKNFVFSSWEMIRSNHPKGVFQRTGIPILAMFLVGIMSLPVKAQITSGTILGTITDPSGAAIPGASVTATNVDTGFERTAETVLSGDFTLVNMPLGNYKVKAEAKGFKTAVSGPFTWWSTRDCGPISDWKLGRWQR